MSIGCVHRSITRIDMLRFSDVYHWKTGCRVSSFAVHCYMAMDFLGVSGQ